MTENKSNQKNILIVDDNPDNLHLLTGILTERGYKVRAVTSGSRAIATIKKEHPDLVMLDIMMPDMDGYQVCKNLKKDKDTSDIPVIFLSALSEIEDKMNAFQVGGVDYISKPFQTEEVIARVDTHLSLKEMQNKLLKQNSKLAQLNHLGQYLQSCQEEEDTYILVSQMFTHIFPSSSGTILIPEADEGDFKSIESWGKPDKELNTFKAKDVGLLYPEAGVISKYTGKEYDDDLINGFSPKRGILHLPIGSPKSIIAIMSFHFHNYEADDDTWISLIDAEKIFLAHIVEHYGLAISNIRLRERLRMESIRDPLTGLYNRRHMEEIIKREANRAERNKSSIGIIMCDIDHFKSFNDNYGHKAGDMILEEMGSLLLKKFRGEDIACRYGGEEFLLILPDISKDELKVRSEELLSNVRKLKLKYQKKILNVTISAGVTVFSGTGSIHDTISKADKALYSAKESGRDQVVVDET